MKLSVRLPAIWRLGCTYNRRNLGRLENCVQVPQDVIRLMVQSPPYQGLKKAGGERQNRSLFAQALTGRECEIVCPTERAVSK